MPDLNTGPLPQNSGALYKWATTSPVVMLYSIVTNLSKFVLSKKPLLEDWLTKLRVFLDTKFVTENQLLPHFLLPPYTPVLGTTGCFAFRWWVAKRAVSRGRVQNSFWTEQNGVADPDLPYFSGSGYHKPNISAFKKSNFFYFFSVKNSGNFSFFHFTPSC